MIIDLRESSEKQRKKIISKLNDKSATHKFTDTMGKRETIYYDEKENSWCYFSIGCSRNKVDISAKDFIKN